MAEARVVAGRYRLVRQLGRGGMGAGREGPQTANLTLADGAVNSVVGTADYPNVGCHYELRLISSASNEVELYEVIQSGLCYSEYVVLTRSGTGITESVYQSQPGGGQQPEFDGRLTKS